MQSDAETSTSQNDGIDPARANALAVTLGRDAEYSAGDALPPFFHQIYFWVPQPAEGLGRDGHPRVGGVIPDLGLPRRMWAGGTLVFHAPLRAGVSARKVTVCENAEVKQGRSGSLGFVRLRHEITQGETLCVTEWHDLVYRNDPAADAVRPVPPAAPSGEDVARTRNFDSTLLFRYSALTFNGHRIHYDEAYARKVEGYDGLVVHGPLLAQHLMLLAQDELGPLSRFSFRATAPLMHHEAADFCLKGSDLWVRAPDGRQCMSAAAEPA